VKNLAELIIAQSRALAGKYRRYFNETVGQDNITIWTWPDLIREVGAAVGPRPTTLLTPLQQSLLVREACLSTRSQLRHFGPIATTRGFWSGMDKFISQLRQNKQSITETIGDPDKAADLEIILNRYEELLATAGSTDLAGRYERLTAAIRATATTVELLPGITELCVVGLAGPNGVQSELLEVLAIHGLTYRHQTSLIQPSRPQQLQLLTAAEPYGEVRAVADRVVALLSAGVSLRDIAVIYPSEQYLDLLRKEFRRRTIALRASTIIRLSAIPLIRRLLTDFGGQPGMATLPDHYANFADYLAQDAAYKRWQSELTEGSAEEIRRLAARELRAVESLLELADQAGAALEGIYGDRTFSARKYAEILSLAAAQTNIWQEPYPGPGLRCVPLGGEASALLARHLFVVGLSQEVLGARRPGWLPELASSPEPTAVLDLLLTEGPQTAVLSVAQADTAGKLNLRPLYFQTLRERWSPPEDQISYYRPSAESVEQRAETELLTRKLAVELARVSSQVTPWDGDLGSVIERIYANIERREFTVSNLESYLNCPFSFYAQNLLKLRSIDVELGEVQAVDEGSLIHAVLSDFFTQVDFPLTTVKQPQYQQLLDRLLAEAINRQRAEYPTILPGAWEISHLRLANFLATVLREELTAAEESDFVPVKVEEPITPLTIETAYGEVTLRGRIDRIDSDGAGAWRLIDYKGGEVKQKEIADYKRIQLAIYAEAWRRKLVENGAELTALEVCYFSYRKGKRTIYRPKSLDGAEAWLQGALQVAQTAVEGILAGNFLPQPPSADNCKWCGFADLCRESGGLQHKKFAVKGGSASV